MHPNASSTGSEAPVLQTFCYVTSSGYWLFSCILYNSLYNKLVNVINVSLSSVDYFSKLIKPKERVVGTPDLQPVYQKHR